MAKALFVVLAAILIVAALANDFEEENTMADFFMAEKRGQSMKKYKYCQQFDQNCWCSRRTNKVVFCNGAGTGDGL